eukprot:CAMPEP_0194352284 /NCGR_PEP_ID=MMETSP0174-20130528/670_1 /TAXON_ID=216777 /ORGANISM="Proboscia alata, Strain PI-D3" /LENGTH=58 /DNA_ID=CAMNT_0039120229 /DNA_START=130 /DNA_END=306 /DNA_ORIENTATION=+
MTISSIVPTTEEGDNDRDDNDLEEDCDYNCDGDEKKKEYMNNRIDGEYVCENNFIGER